MLWCGWGFGVMHQPKSSAPKFVTVAPECNSQFRGFWLSSIALLMVPLLTHPTNHPSILTSIKQMHQMLRRVSDTSASG